MSEQNRNTTERRYILLPEAFAVNGTGLPEAVFRLRKRLYIKAKQAPKYRFYTLYDRIYRRDVLAAAWARVAANNGKPGVDGISIEDVETSPQGVEGFLKEIHETLKSKRYRPQAAASKPAPLPSTGRGDMVCTSIQATGLGATMTAKLLCDSLAVKATGKRSAGNLHAAFDEGDQG